MTKFQQNHAILLKEAQDKDLEYASLTGTDELE